MKIFYIAPHNFDPEFQVKFQLFESIAEIHSISVVKGVKSGEQQFDLDKTMELFKEVDCFVADLSFERPSCYYEVGHAQALNKSVRLIAKVNTEIHQVKGNVNLYSGIESYKNLIKKIISELDTHNRT